MTGFFLPVHAGNPVDQVKYILKNPTMIDDIKKIKKLLRMYRNRDSIKRIISNPEIFLVSPQEKQYRWLDEYKALSRAIHGLYIQITPYHQHLTFHEFVDLDAMRSIHLRTGLCYRLDMRLGAIENAAMQWQS